MEFVRALKLRIRAMVRSFPKKANVSKIGGLIVVPLTATRMGCATFPSPKPARFTIFFHCFFNRLGIPLPDPDKKISYGLQRYRP